MAPHPSALPHRRDLLRHGLAGIAGLSLADVLRLRADVPTGKKPRSIIMVCLAGGPSHLDMYDLKPGAPEEVRGEFKPVKTVVPGFDICEHFPLQARITDKLALVRSLQFVEPMQHELEEVYSGFPKSAKRPSFGSVISRFKGDAVRGPAYVSLEYSTGTSSYESPQYVGASHRAMHISGGEGVRNLGLLNGISRNRLEDRRGLLRDFDNYRREQDARRESQDMDAHSARAFDILGAPQVRDAFDLSREPEKVKARYGDKDAKFIYAGKDADSYWYGHNFLLARRLVEAGVPVVTMRAGLWDHHGNVIQQVGGKSIWHSLRSALPLLDQSIHALVTDLHDRGLQDEVMVLVWGEFGRTPKISQTGRDHWPDASFALFAGAGCHGQVIGETDSRGERPKTRPLGPQNVLGTIYHALGIDHRQTINDFSGRPTQLLEQGEPIAELTE